MTRGWVRVDPTAVVAPERLTRDIFDLIPAAQRSTSSLLRASPWIGQLLQSFEALNAWWQDRVIGFDVRRQLALLGALGLDDGDWRSLGVLLAGGASAWLLWIGWSMRDQLRPVRRDALARTWLMLEKKLARAGFPRAAHEGPLAFAARVGSGLPALERPLTALARRYAELRFGTNDRPDRTQLSVRQLRAAIRALTTRG